MKAKNPIDSSAQIGFTEQLLEMTRSLPSSCPKHRWADRNLTGLPRAIRPVMERYVRNRRNVKEATNVAQEDRYVSQRTWCLNNKIGFFFY